MPEPSIDALAFKPVRHSTPLLGIRLELGLQGRELGERRIRIGRLFAPLEALDRRTVTLTLRPITVARRPVLAMFPGVPAAMMRMAFLRRGHGAGWLNLLGCWQGRRLTGRNGGHRLRDRLRGCGARASWAPPIAMFLARSIATLAPPRPPNIDHDRFGGGRGLRRHRLNKTGIGRGRRSEFNNRARLGFRAESSWIGGVTISASTKGLSTSIAAAVSTTVSASSIDAAEISMEAAGASTLGAAASASPAATAS